MRNDRPRVRFSVVPLVALGALVLVSFLGARTLAGPSTKDKARYFEILSLIEERHVPETDVKKVIYSSVHGMLQTLDPHTYFLDDDSYREMREEQRGSFYGLGIVISKGGRYQPLRVVSPIADTPAARMGVRAGDVITHIRDQRTDVDIDTMGLTIQESVKHLRGPRGTEVEVTIDRPGMDEPLLFTITRDAIKTPAVNQAHMIRPTVGFVSIANFTENTAAELDEALATLSDAGMERLILDLRSNPGGLLEQAISVGSRFLDPGELVVYTEGRVAGSRQDYDALRDVPRYDWPMIVLIDGGSASASEIVAGALQDHDRALLLGQTTFGKGLVQSVYPLSNNTGLALTTQKYYSPIGRTIQRPYDAEEEYYFRGDEKAPDSDSDDEEFTTATGRIIVGGGGISPDTVIEAEPLPGVVTQLARLSLFSRFVNPLDDELRTRYAGDVDAFVAHFKTFIAEEAPEIELETFDESRERVALQLRAELALATEGMPARDRILLASDRAVLTALETFGEAEDLLASRKKARSGGQGDRAALKSPVAE